MFATRHAREILRNGGPRTAREYYFIFPLACRSCGGRDIDRMRIELNPREVWCPYAGGYYYSKNDGWKTWLECRKCGCSYNVEVSFFFETSYPNSKDIKTWRASSVDVLNRDVNWHKLVDIEGFKPDEIPEKLP